MKRVLIGNMPLYNNTPAYVQTNAFLVITLQFLGILVLVSLAELRDYFKIYSLIIRKLQEMRVYLYLMLMGNMKVPYQFKIVRCFLRDIQLT